MQQQLDPAHEDLKREKFTKEAWEYLLDEDEKWTGIIRTRRKWFSDQENGKREKSGLDERRILFHCCQGLY